jgi:hypothetical protein
MVPSGFSLHLLQRSAGPPIDDPAVNYFLYAQNSAQTTIIMMQPIPVMSFAVSWEASWTGSLVAMRTAILYMFLFSLLALPKER